MNITEVWLVLVAGVILSLLFSYVPGLRTKYAALSGEVKRVIMLVLLIIVSVGVYGLNCYGLIPQGNLTCDKSGILTLVNYFILAVVSNQTAYTISPQLSDVRAAKE
jgi:hypothetical protein